MLSDANKRQIYDQFGEAGLQNGGMGGGPGGPGGFGAGMQFHDPMDIFQSIFGIYIPCENEHSQTYSE